MKHFLKCWPEYFQEVKAGRKLFEIRKWDRPYKVGDTLLLREFDRIKQEETGDEIEVEVVYLLDMTYLPGDNVPHFANYCCMSLRQTRTEPCYSLATENERLKDERKRLIENNTILSDALDRANAKLDAVRAECEESRQSGRRLSALRLLEIIDKDGE